jgi:membrane protease YdiL (CAAX protease family)
MDAETPTPPHAPAAADATPDNTRSPLPLAADTVTATEALSPQPSLPERIFKSEHGVRTGWRIFLYYALAVAIALLLGWLGSSFFQDARSAQGASRLWARLFSEFSVAAGAILPAFLLARIESRPFDDYGLPRTAAFGWNFWIGAVWGFGGITLLLVLLDGAKVFDFGALDLHGVRILKFAAFWGLYFLLVAFFEEFFFRGYVLFTLRQRMGFWPAALLLSIIFGGVHIQNSGETWIGALAAGLIGFFFCLTLLKTGSLWWAVGFHAAWDWGETFFFGVPDSATVEPGHLLTPQFHGSRWLTGGSVGPEGSVLVFVVVAVMWLAFDRLYPQPRLTIEKPAA